MNDCNYDELDPGIRRTVAYLRGLGYETTDSGDGRTKAEAIAEGLALPFPHIVIRVSSSALIGYSHDLAKLMLDRVPDGHIEASYDPSDGIALVTVCGVADEAFFK